MASLYRSEKIQEKYNLLANNFHLALESGEKCEVAKDYLVARNIGKSQIEDFQIGWCPENVKIKKSNFMNLLAGRVIFPIKDEYGDVICFSGRLPILNKKDLPENSPKWFHQSYP